MATSPPSSNTPYYHPKKRRLMLYFILALAGVGLFTIAHWFYEKSQEVSDLYNVYYMIENKNHVLKRSVESLEMKQFSRDKHVEDLSSRVSQYQKELSCVSKQTESLEAAMNTQSQDIDEVKREMEAFDTVIQTITNSQVSDIQRNEDLWKAIKTLEESAKTHMNADTAQVIFETLFTKFEEIGKELSQQKSKVEELVNIKGQQYDKLKTAFYNLKDLMGKRVDIESAMTLIKAFITNFEDLANEISLQKTKIEKFSNSRKQHIAEIWKAIKTLQSDSEKIQTFESTRGYSQDLYFRLDNMGQGLRVQLQKLEEFGKQNELHFNHFNEIWNDLNKLKNEVISTTNLENLQTLVGDLNKRVENFFLQLKSQNIKIEKVSEQVLLENNIRQDEELKKGEKPVNGHRRTYNKEESKLSQQEEKKTQEAKNEGKESMRQKAMNAANSAMKEVGHFTKKIKGEIGKQTEKVSRQVEKMKKAFYRLFG